MLGVEEIINLPLISLPLVPDLQLGFWVPTPGPRPGLSVLGGPPSPPSWAELTEGLARMRWQKVSSGDAACGFVFVCCFQPDNKHAGFTQSQNTQNLDIRASVYLLDLTVFPGP